MASARRSPPSIRPDMSDLRIVLIGKNRSENRRVGNTILGTKAFQSEASSHSQQHSVRISGEVEERKISVINTHLLQTHLSDYQITQRVRQCVSLSAPGPLVFVLVLQYKDFTENDRHRVIYVLKLFSEQAMKHTIVVTTDEETWAFMFTSKNESVHDLIKECGGGHLQFDPWSTGWRSEMFRRTEEILNKEHKEHPISVIYEDKGRAQYFSKFFQRSSSVRGDAKEKVPDLTESTKTASDGVTTSGKAKLNIVLCGNNPALKNSVSRMFRGVTSEPAHEEMRKVCQKREGTIHGRQISVIELPVLSQLSEEEVMRETLSCVSLCDPGVHLFILATPVTKLTNQDRAEMKKIKAIFTSNEHFMVLFITEYNVDKTVRDFVKSTESKSIVSVYGSWHSVMGLKDQRRSEQISDLFNHIDNMKIEPYSLQMYMRAPEKRVRHELEEKLRVRDNEIKELQQKINTLDAEVVKLNLVVCGSNRGLKSFISELILNQSERRSELSSECVRRDVELDGRLISLVELPALLNTQLSEEEVMCQIHCCVSLCHPGVHVLIIIIPDAPLNNEDKAEIEEIQKIFSSRINKHIMVLIKQSSDHQTAELNEETQSVIQSLGGRHHFIDLNTQVSVLMEKLQQMVEDNSGACFSTETLMEAQKLKGFNEMKRRNHSLEMWFKSKDSRERKVRIVLLGSTRAGKSSTGNTILGRKVFISDFSEESVTKVCQKETDKINGRHITVIDTPGLFDTDLSNEEIQREITNCISMILPGPHVFLLLIPVGRFTKEEQTAVKIIQETFGENSLKYTIVLFTRGDFLKKKTIDKFLGKPRSALNQLIEACGNRYHVFNNETEDRTQVTDLLQKIDNMVKENGDSYYSCKMFREMEREIQEQQKNTLMERVEQLSREGKELMKKHEEEKKQLKMKMEEGKLNHEKERKRRENEFREREEQYKRDLKEREEGERNIREELKREREEWYRQRQEERQRREEEEEKWRKKEQMQDEHNQRLKQERERMKKEEEVLQSEHEKQRKRREDKFIEREEQYKTYIKEIEEQERKIQEELKREREEWEKYKQEERERREGEEEKWKNKEQVIWDEYDKRLKQERERMKMRMEEDRKSYDKERRRREEEYKEREEDYKRDIKETQDQERSIREELKREREEWEKQRQEERQRREEEERRRKTEQETWDEYYEKLKQERERRLREREELQIKHDEERERMKKMMEEERQNHERERKRREEEYNEREEQYLLREEQYKRDIKEREEQERKMREELKREREEWEKQRQQEQRRREEEEERRMKKEQTMWDEYNQRLKQERERMKMMLEEERQTREKERKRREEEYKEREEEYKIEIQREREEREKQQEQERLRREEEEEEKDRKEIMGGIL